MKNDKFPATITKVGMPNLPRPPAKSREQLVKFARVAVPLFVIQGAPNTAAVCDAYLAEVAENDLLRRQLASMSEWRDEPTRRVDPHQDSNSRITDTVEVPETTLVGLRVAR